MDNTERIRLLEGYQKICRLQQTEDQQEHLCVHCDVCHVVKEDSE